MDLDLSFLNQYPHILTVSQVADILQLGDTTVYEMYHANKLQGPRVGAKEDGIRIYRSSLEQYLLKWEKKAEPTPTKPTIVPRKRRRPRQSAQQFRFHFPPASEPEERRSAS